jgi:ATP-dependent 26S proteasome regulatory subunit
MTTAPTRPADSSMTVRPAIKSAAIRPAWMGPPKTDIGSTTVKSAETLRASKAYISGHAIEHYRDRIENLKDPTIIVERIRALIDASGGVVGVVDGEEHSVSFVYHGGNKKIGPAMRITVLIDVVPPEVVTVYPVTDAQKIAAAVRGAWEIREE